MVRGLAFWLVALAFSARVIAGPPPAVSLDVDRMAKLRQAWDDIYTVRLDLFDVREAAAGLRQELAACEDRFSRTNRLFTRQAVSLEDWQRDRFCVESARAKLTWNEARVAELTAEIAFGQSGADKLLGKFPTDSLAETAAKHRAWLEAQVRSAELEADVTRAALSFHLIEQARFHRLGAGGFAAPVDVAAIDYSVRGDELRLKWQLARREEARAELALISTAIYSYNIDAIRPTWDCGSALSEWRADLQLRQSRLAMAEAHVEMLSNDVAWSAFTRDYTRRLYARSAETTEDMRQAEISLARERAIVGERSAQIAEWQNEVSEAQNQLRVLSVACARKSG